MCHPNAATLTRIAALDTKIATTQADLKASYKETSGLLNRIRELEQENLELKATIQKLEDHLIEAGEMVEDEEDFFRDDRSHD